MPLQGRWYDTGEGLGMLCQKCPTGSTTPSSQPFGAMSCRECTECTSPNMINRLQSANAEGLPEIECSLSQASLVDDSVCVCKAGFRRNSETGKCDECIDEVSCPVGTRYFSTAHDIRSSLRSSLMFGLGVCVVSSLMAVPFGD